MYAHHFGLRAEPFSLTPDPAFLYRSPAHSEALAALEIGLRGRRGLMVMTGEVGTGKTTLLYSLLRQLESEVRTAYLSNTKLSFDDMLQHALVDFGIACSSTERLAKLNALNAFLQTCACDGTTAALVIDEAQNLDIDTFENLRLLSNFETFTSKLLQIVLVGQPELEFKLKSENLRQVAERVAVHCHINPLTWSESRKYVEHRLQCVGGSVSIFAPRALRLAMRRSQGIPRRINIVCHNALLFAYGRGARTVSWSHVRAAVREREGRGLVITGSSSHAAQSSWKRWLAAPGTVGLALAALTLSWKGSSLFPLSGSRTLDSQWRGLNATRNGGEALPPNDRQGVTDDSPYDSRHSTFDTAHEPSILTHENGAQDPLRSLPLLPSPATEEGQDGGAFLSTLSKGDSSPSSSQSALNQRDNEGRSEVTSPEPADNSRFRLVHVAPGATLGSLTKEVYGAVRPDLLERVRAANPQIADMNRILAGDILRFPEDDASGQSASMIELDANRASHE